jgi:hypothetical protein
VKVRRGAVGTDDIEVVERLRVGVLVEDGDPAAVGGPGWRVCARLLTIGNAGCRRFSSFVARRSSREFDAIPRKGHCGSAENDDE